MKHYCSSLFAFVALVFLWSARQAVAQKSDTFTAPNGKQVVITHIKHASVQIEYDGKVFYVDPVIKLKPETDFYNSPKADFLLVTHEHSDHFDPVALTRLSKSGTAFFMNSRCYRDMQKGVVMANGDSLQIGADIKLWAVPAYNTTPDRVQYHPKNRDNGYILELGGLRIYLAGDTEDIPEMAAVKNIDIAFLPCNQPYTMTVAQLVRAAKVIGPKVLFPYHFGETSVNQIVMQLAGSGIDVRIRSYK